METSPLNDLAIEIMRDYGEWIENGVYTTQQILIILLLKEREKNKVLVKKHDRSEA